VKSFFVTFSILLIACALGIYGFLQRDHIKEIYYALCIVGALATLFTGALLGYLENIRSAFGLIASLWAILWSVGKMIASINFDAPFLTSFYWSTVGYLLLTLILLIPTIYFLIGVCKKPDKSPVI
jgi:hypothetical protein